MRKINKSLILSLLLCPMVLFGQQFSHSAKLGSVAADGFYSIPLTPDISGYVDVSLKDLRILNSKGEQVPYIMRSILPELKNDHFTSLPISSNTRGDSGQTILVLDNSKRAFIHEIALVLRNASVSRIAKISGSDDNNKWFAIAEGLELKGGQNSDKDRFVLNLDFPLSSYRYLKLVINNFKNDPLNIIEANYRMNEEWSRRNFRRENPAPEFIQKDSADGYSYITVMQQKAYHVNKISVFADKPKFYNRPLEVRWKNGYAEFTIRPNASSYSFPTFNDSAFTLRIYNGDNPPLKITSITTSQEARHIIAYLEKDEQYQLVMGNDAVNAPVYDLSAFKDSIPSNTPELQVEAIQSNQQSIIKKEEKTNLSLWLIIAGVLAILSFFTWNLTKELKKRNL